MRLYVAMVLALLVLIFAIGWIVGGILPVAEAQQSTRMVLDHSGRYTAPVSDIGATLTQIVAAPSGGQSVYITSIVLVSSTATAGAFNLQSGTGTNCATGTLGVFPQWGLGSPTLTIPYPANTVAPLVIFLPQPIKLPASAALCVLGTATNLARGTVVGFVAP